MSTNKIDKMTEQEAKSLLNEIAESIGIGGKSRSGGVILANVRNALRRSQCLSRIEHFHIETELDEDGEENLNSLLNWGESPDVYIETYKGVVSA